MRFEERQENAIRTVKITRNYIEHAEGSALIEVGKTRVLCVASVEEKVPPFLKGSGKGWINAEYALLPRSTQTRNSREAARGKQTGRTHEIQRLIGRSLRSVIRLEALGERTIWLDCDVIQADGGTRTAAITGAFVALVDALKTCTFEEGTPFPICDFLAAVSVGLVEGKPLLDLDYSEDSQAEVDMNLVMTGSGQFVEIQGTGEQRPFTKAELAVLTEYGELGIAELVRIQKEILGEDAKLIGS